VPSGAGAVVAGDDVLPRPAARPAALVAAAGIGCVVLARFGVTTAGVIEAFTAGVLVALAAIDLQHRLIPNRIVLPSAAAVLVAHTAVAPGHAAEWALAALGAALFLLLPMLVYPSGMGMGDVKLALLLGAALGTLVLAALTVAFLVFTLFALGMFARHGVEARKSTVPMGPFLAFGAIAVMLLGGPHAL
jgi:leader peptidase (prepilin peptidase) / N-methyltransferase